MWSLLAGVVICLAAVGGILVNLYVLLALLLAKQVPIGLTYQAGTTVIFGLAF
jgi:hypothetical protein